VGVRAATTTAPAPTTGTGAVVAVQATGLTKAFAGRTAVDAVDLSVPAGHVHGLLGPNGAGKTTLLRMLLGLVRPDAGSLRLLGRDQQDGGPGALAGVAAVVGAPGFYLALSGRRNLALLGALDGSVPPGRVDQVLGPTGLTDRADDAVRGYSLGMRSRLGLAAALLRGPRLLLLDEPANGLDPSGRRDLRRLLRELAADGVAVVLSSHDMDEVAEVCDEVTVLRSGAVRFAGSLAALRAQAPDPASLLRTSDDPRALQLAASVPALRVTAVPAGGLLVRCPPPDLDSYVLLLGHTGIAVRALQEQTSPLVAAFLDLTGQP